MTHSLQHLFHAVLEERGNALGEGHAIYFSQIQSRLVVTPANTILKRCQNIWGRSFLHRLLANFYAAHPPRSYRWNVTLENLPLFVSEHPKYSQVFALSDTIELCLQSWQCLHGIDPPCNPKAEHQSANLLQSTLAVAAFWIYPKDQVDLCQLWQDSAQDQDGADAACWQRWANAPQRGLILIKQSARDVVTLALYARDRTLLAGLARGHSVKMALSLLEDREIAEVANTLPDTLALWSQYGLLQPPMEKLNSEAPDWALSHG